MVDQGPPMDAQCPSWAASLGYMGVAAAVCLSNCGSAVSRVVVVIIVLSVGMPFRFRFGLRWRVSYLRIAASNAFVSLGYLSDGHMEGWNQCYQYGNQTPELRHEECDPHCHGWR